MFCSPSGVRYSICYEPILLNIFQFLDEKTQLNFKNTSKLFYTIYNDSNVSKTLYFNDNTKLLDFLQWIKFNLYFRKNINHLVFGENISEFLEGIEYLEVSKHLESVNTISITNNFVNCIENLKNVIKLNVLDNSQSQNEFYDLAPMFNLKELYIYSFSFFYSLCSINDLSALYPNLELLIIELQTYYEYPIFMFLIPYFNNLKKLKRLEFNTLIYNDDASILIEKLVDNVEYIKIKIMNKGNSKDTIIYKLPKNLKVLEIDYRYNFKGYLKIESKGINMELNDDKKIYLKL